MYESYDISGDMLFAIYHCFPKGRRQVIAYKYYDRALDMARKLHKPNYTYTDQYIAIFEIKGDRGCVFTTQGGKDNFYRDYSHLKKKEVYKHRDTISKTAEEELVKLRKSLLSLADRIKKVMESLHKERE